MTLRIDTVEVAWSVQRDKKDVRCRKGEIGMLRAWGRIHECRHDGLFFMLESIKLFNIFQRIECLSEYW